MRSRGYEVVNLGADYRPEEIEFLLAVDHWKRRHEDRTPNCGEVLEIARSLGWEKPLQETEHGKPS